MVELEVGESEEDHATVEGEPEADEESEVDEGSARSGKGPAGKQLPANAIQIEGHEQVSKLSVYKLRC
jgi:hypothetical protein